MPAPYEGGLNPAEDAVQTLDILDELAPPGFQEDLSWGPRDRSAWGLSNAVVSKALYFDWLPRNWPQWGHMVRQQGIAVAAAVLRWADSFPSGGGEQMQDPPPYASWVRSYPWFEQDPTSASYYALVGQMLSMSLMLSEEGNAEDTPKIITTPESPAVSVIAPVTQASDEIGLDDKEARVRVWEYPGVGSTQGVEITEFSKAHNRGWGRVEQGAVVGHLLAWIQSVMKRGNAQKGAAV